MDLSVDGLADCHAIQTALNREILATCRIAEENGKAELAAVRSQSQPQSVPTVVPKCCAPCLANSPESGSFEIPRVRCFNQAAPCALTFDCRTNHLLFFFPTGKQPTLRDLLSFAAQLLHWGIQHVGLASFAFGSTAPLLTPAAFSRLTNNLPHFRGGGEPTRLMRVSFLYSSTQFRGRYVRAHARSAVGAPGKRPTMQFTAPAA